MFLNEKQYNYLVGLIKNHTLKKDINLLTPFEGALIIEGILNGNKVKESYKGTIFTKEQYNLRQIKFDSLVEPKSLYITEKQMEYIEGLCRSSNYELCDKSILKSDVSIIIDFLKNNIPSEKAKEYLKIPETKSLIKIKSAEKIDKPDLPTDWVIYNVELNGIIDF